MQRRLTDLAADAMSGDSEGQIRFKPRQYFTDLDECSIDKGAGVTVECDLTGTKVWARFQPMSGVTMTFSGGVIGTLKRFTVSGIDGDKVNETATVLIDGFRMQRVDARQGAIIAPRP